MRNPEEHAVPRVSVIVPARNEEASLGHCLGSLVAQEGIEREIIVVDDGSTDGTAAIARSVPGVRLVEARPLPPGWVGKCNALVCGTGHARGEWLLFTDADTYHLIGSLSRAVQEAESHAADLLSYSPGQELRGLLQHALMPVIFSDLAATYPPSRVSDPRSPEVAANGQYLLIRRKVYEAIGGHGAVGGELLEDVALARRVKLAGYRVRFRLGADAVRARMYRSTEQMVEGWTKNLALLFPAPHALAARRVAEFAAVTGGTALGVAAAASGRPVVASAAFVTAAAVYALMLRRVRRAHFGAGSTALAVLGLPMFARLLLRSAGAHARGRVNWKGRTYGGSQEQPTGRRQAGKSAG